MPIAVHHKASRLCPTRWGMACLLCLLVVTGGCSYGPISPAAYDYATALYSVTNRQATDRLPAIKQQIADAEASGELSSREANWLNDIIAEAEQGNWKEASHAARQMMEDQVEK